MKVKKIILFAIFTGVLACALYHRYDSVKKESYAKRKHMNDKSVEALLDLRSKVEINRDQGENIKYLEYLSAYDGVVVVKLYLSGEEERYLYIYEYGDIDVLGEKKLAVSDILKTEIIWSKAIRERELIIMRSSPPKKN